MQGFDKFCYGHAWWRSRRRTRDGEEKECSAGRRAGAFFFSFRCFVIPIVIPSASSSWSHRPPFTLFALFLHSAYICCPFSPTWHCFFLLLLRVFLLMFLVVFPFHATRPQTRKTAASAVSLAATIGVVAAVAKKLISRL